MVKEEDDETFFNLFKDNAENPEHQHEEEDDENEEGNCPSDLIHLDYEIVMNLIDESVPYSLEHYLGIENDDYIGGDDDMMGDEDDEEEEEEKPKKKAVKPKKKKSSDAGETKATGDVKPECKQQ